jgi:hypothetical protein
LCARRASHVKCRHDAAADHRALTRKATHPRGLRPSEYALRFILSGVCARPTSTEGVAAVNIPERSTGSAVIFMDFPWQPYCSLLLLVSKNNFLGSEAPCGRTKRAISIRARPRRPKAAVTDPMPTQAGDVLILYKDGSPMHVIGLLSDDAQQTVSEHQIQEIGRRVAIETAKGLVRRGRRIYLKNIDTGWWVGLK